jgi:hypothetical protein
VIVLHAFSPSTPAVRQRATWTTLELLRRHGRHVMIDWPCLRETDYAEGISWCWNRGEVLCVLEHDLVPELEHLVELEACTQPICTQAYELHTSGGEAYAFRVREDGVLRWGREGESWADYFPLGCTRFSVAAQQRLASSWALAGGWHGVDHWLSEALGQRAHVHWPAIRHVHH